MMEHGYRQLLYYLSLLALLVCFAASNGIPALVCLPIALRLGFGKAE